jgi:asparagine synthase (glutamine-hydrolysing)
LPALALAVPRSLRASLRRLAGGNASIPDWIAPSFARGARLGERLAPKEPLRWPSFAQTDLWAYSMSGLQVHVLEVEERFTSCLGIEQRHPLSDRRLVEFALSVPEDVRWWRDQPKYILREAVRGFLPESVRLRRTKASFSHIVPEVLSTESVRGVLSRLQAADEGWVDQRRIDTLYRTWAAGSKGARSDSGADAYSLWSVYAVELWLRALKGRSGVEAGLTR